MPHLQKVFAILIALAVLATYRSQSVYADPDRAADEARMHQVSVHTQMQPSKIEAIHNVNFANPATYAPHTSNNGETVGIPTDAQRGLPTDLDLFFRWRDETTCRRATDVTRVRVDRTEHNVVPLWASPSVGSPGVQCRYRVVYEHN